MENENEIEMPDYEDQMDREYFEEIEDMKEDSIKSDNEN